MGSRVGRMWNLDNDPIETFYNPEINLSWTDKTDLGFGYNYNKILLTPTDYVNLPQDATLEEKNVSLSFDYEVDARFDFALSAQSGTAVNFAPADGIPKEADRWSYQVYANWKPINPLSINGRFLYLQLEDDTSGELIFDNKIARFNANWQFTRELSLRLIGQYEDTEANPSQSRILDRRTFNTDVLVRYVMNPWTALYVGYNNNKRNFEIIEGEHGDQIRLTDSALKEDGRQYFLKFSYLFQL